VQKAFISWSVVGKLPVEDENTSHKHIEFLTKEFVLFRSAMVTLLSNRIYLINIMFFVMNPKGNQLFLMFIRVPT